MGHRSRTGTSDAPVATGPDWSPQTGPAKPLHLRRTARTTSSPMRSLARGAAARGRCDRPRERSSGLVGAAGFQPPAQIRVCTRRAPMMSAGVPVRPSTRSTGSRARMRRAWGHCRGIARARAAAPVIPARPSPPPGSCKRCCERSGGRCRSSGSRRVSSTRGRRWRGDPATMGRRLADDIEASQPAPGAETLSVRAAPP
jgi:hypothetical protein